MSEPTESDKFYVNYIVQQRIYDLLAVIARALNKEEAEQVLQAHEHGIVIAPDPSLSAPAPADKPVVNVHDREEIHRAVVEAERNLDLGYKELAVELKLEQTLGKHGKASEVFVDNSGRWAKEGNDNG